MAAKLTVFNFGLISTVWIFHIACALQVKYYCKYGQENSPCKYQCKKGAGCEHVEKFVSLTDKERDHIVWKHNFFRNEVAGGKYEKENFLPTAKIMYALSYDREMEFFAACYITQCIYEHEKVRQVDRFKHLGQNLFQIYANHSGIKMDEKFLDEAVQEWFDEKKVLTKKNSQQLFSSFRVVKGAGHLSAMLWWNIQYVGCAKYHFKQKGMHYFHLYCDYGPTGNIDNKVMYETESQNCSAGMMGPNKEFPNLCGRVRPLADDNYVSPSKGSRAEYVLENLIISFVIAIFVYYL